jgi:hypothetical protein
MKDKAYDLMSKKKKASDETTKTKTFEKTTTEPEKDILISKINKKSTIQKSATPYIENIRKTEEGFVFDVVTTINGEIIKDLLLPADKVYPPKREEAQQHLIESQQKQKKMIKFAIIYPAAIVSLIVIIHGFITILPMLQGLFK